MLLKSAADYENIWTILILSKHIIVLVMVGCAAFQTITISKMDMLLSQAQQQNPKEAPKGPPPELLSLKKRQMIVSTMVIIFGILTLLLTAIAEGL